MDRKKNVLIVDDEELIVSTVSRYLSARGYAVTATTLSECAMDAIETGSFDIVITDLKMQPYSGLDIIKRLRELKFGGKIVLITAFQSEVQATIEALKVGCVLEKPFSLGELLLKIQGQCDEKQAEAE
ncbi:MAG: response regulator [Alphaproteobacteria bacterium]|uniref:Response regulator n=1 Tax=Candidatus Nitrobium versatile TaxID=2884831 RepID=A0A953JC49_9BACT|nr:response regulator [Candidatus Nitrobium versatile]